MTGALEGGEWLAARSGRTLPPGKTRYHFTGGWVGPRASLDGRNNLVTTGIRSRTVQPVVSRYTDWATRPTFWINFVHFVQTPTHKKNHSEYLYFNGSDICAGWYLGCTEMSRGVGCKLTTFRDSFSVPSSKSIPNRTLGEGTDRLSQVKSHNSEALKALSYFGREVSNISYSLQL